jgi:hypothetical protein
MQSMKKEKLNFSKLFVLLMMAVSIKMLGESVYADITQA